MHNPETRSTLIVQLKSQQDEAAWWEFVRTYESFLQRLVERRGVPAMHVPDVTQQVLTAIARSIGSWQDDGQEASFRRWVNRVARNVVIKYMARERHHAGGQGGTEALQLLAEVPAEQDTTLAKQYEHELIVWAAEQVREEFLDSSWRAFWATMIEGREVAQVAEELSLSIGSIYMSRSRIKKRIREKVAEVLES